MSEDIARLLVLMTSRLALVAIVRVGLLEWGDAE